MNDKVTENRGTGQTNRQEYIEQYYEQFFLLPEDRKTELRERMQRLQGRPGNDLGSVKTVESTLDVIDNHLAHLYEADREEAWLILADTNYRVFSIEAVGFGTVDRVIWTNLTTKFRRQGLAHVVAVHNHPQGGNPSQLDVADVLLMFELVAGAQGAGVNLLDYVIIASGTNTMYSARKSGLVNPDRLRGLLRSLLERAAKEEESE